jgi:GT2 family glycosyltransferase
VHDPHPQIAVAVVSWNTRALLGECLESLEPDAASGLAEVWVVDNASSDGSAELVRQRFPWARLIASDANLGFGAGVNLVADRTRTPWLAPANADVRLTDGALQRLLDEGESHPRAGVIAPRLILPDGSTQHSVYPFPTVPFTLAYVSGAVARSRRLSRYWCIDQGFDADRGREVAWAVGACMLVRRRAWDTVGGFDTRQWMYAEDLDLGWRLHRAGWGARYAPEARVFHAESAATRQAWGGERHARWHASTYAWMLRRRGAPIARIVAAINVAGFLMRAGLSSTEQTRRDAFHAARAHAIGLRRRELLARVR